MLTLWVIGHDLTGLLFDRNCEIIYWVAAAAMGRRGGGRGAVNMSMCQSFSAEKLYSYF